MQIQGIKIVKKHKDIIIILMLDKEKENLVFIHKLL